MARRLLVVADRPDGDGADRDLVALLGWLDGQGWSSRLLVWDRADLGRRLGRRPTTEVEAINRWRLPLRLERHGRRAAMRRLRHLRVRWWWLRQRRVRVVLLWGPQRPEVRHYLPPDRPVVGVRSDPRSAADPVGEPSDEVAAELAGVQVRVRRCGPSGADPSAPLAITSWGPGADRPLDGADRFLRLLWTLRAARPDRAVRGRWAGGDARSRDWEPTTWARDRLGLEAVVELLPEAAVDPDLADSTSVLVLTAPWPTRPWPTDHLVRAGVPIRGVEAALVLGPQLDDAAVAGERTTPWPDLSSLAAEVDRALDQVEAARQDVRALRDALERA